MKVKLNQYQVLESELTNDQLKIILRTNGGKFLNTLAAIMLPKDGNKYADRVFERIVLNAFLLRVNCSKKRK